MLQRWSIDLVCQLHRVPRAFDGIVAHILENRCRNVKENTYNADFLGHRLGLLQRALCFYSSIFPGLCVPILLYFHGLIFPKLYISMDLYS